MADGRVAPVVRRATAPRELFAWVMRAQPCPSRTSSCMAADRRSRTDREVPIIPRVEITVEQAAKRLRRLTPEKLRRVQRHEQAYMKRTNVLEAIDALLRGEMR